MAVASLRVRGKCAYVYERVFTFFLSSVSCTQYRSYYPLARLHVLRIAEKQAGRQVNKQTARA